MFQRFPGVTILKITSSFLAMLSGGRRGLLGDRRSDDGRRPEQKSERKPQPAVIGGGDRFSQRWFEVDLHGGSINITAWRRGQAFRCLLAISRSARIRF